jgi:hypothetical protein
VKTNPIPPRLNRVAVFFLMQNTRTLAYMRKKQYLCSGFDFCNRQTSIITTGIPLWLFGFLY